jgi:hypothetical protein
MTFNIGSQQGGVVNNVAGDQIISGGQHVTIASTAEALAVVEGLRGDISRAPIAGSSRAVANDVLDDIERELRRSEPDKPTIGSRLARLTNVLVTAGGLVTGGTTLLTGIAALATWLGSAGAATLGLVRRVTR